LSSSKPWALYYRLGRYRESVDQFSRAGAAWKAGPTSCDQFFLAMSYHRLGETAKARECYERAINWWRQRRSGLADV